DFWGTWCTHCLQAAPDLNRLSQNYSSYGLEVIGIAEERGTQTQEQVKKIRGMPQRFRMEYLVLLGGGVDGNCPVSNQFRVTGYPTAVLLDEHGVIVWRSRDEQGLDPQALRELEFEIKKRLNIR